MSVFVINKDGKPLMPTTEAKAAKLLKSGKAVVYSKRPFAIQLKYRGGNHVSATYLGIDTGSQKIGIGVVDGDGKILYQSEIQLRSTMAKRSLLETRRDYRRGRRYRNTPYRHPKFKHPTKRIFVPEGYKIEKKKKGKGRIQDKYETRYWMKLKLKSGANFASNRHEGWLPPSIQSKVDHHIDWIRRYLNLLPESTKLAIEIARFDIARMKDPTIHGALYQKGRMADYENTRAYVFDRDEYTCRVCGKKSGDKNKNGGHVKFHAHHLDYRSKGATDNPDRMITVCLDCHTAKAHEPGGVLYDWKDRKRKTARGHRDATLMNIVAVRIRNAFPEATFTYGNLTKDRRKTLLLEKTHSNDAVAIALCNTDIQKVSGKVFMYRFQQCRKKKRSLHEGIPRKSRTPSKPNREAKRNKKNTKASLGVCLWDKVSFRGDKGWVTGFSGANCRINDKFGEYIMASEKSNLVSISEIRVLNHNNNWLIGPEVALGRGS